MPLELDQCGYYSGPGSAERAWGDWRDDSANFDLPPVDVPATVAKIRERRRRGRIYLAARAVVQQRLNDDGPNARLEEKKRRLAFRHDHYVDQAYFLGKRLWEAGVGELANEVAAEHSILQRKRIEAMVAAYRARRPR